MRASLPPYGIWLEKKMPIVTHELMERGRRNGGLWTEKQLGALGTRSYCNSGWYDRLIGTTVTQGQVDQFLALRNPKDRVKKENPRPHNSALFTHPFTKALEPDHVTDEYRAMFSGTQASDDGKVPWDD